MHKIFIQGTDISFDNEQSESILNSGLNNKIPMVYSCRTGRCKSCKCKVISGLTQPLSDELGLSHEEKAAGWILSCARTSLSNLVLEVEKPLDRVFLEPIILPTKIHKMEYASPDVLIVHLRLPPNRKFDYYPGQYVDILAEGTLKRSYSIANALILEQLISFHIKLLPNGAMSNYWKNKAKVGDLVRIKGPYGSFCLPKTLPDGASLIFVATGTGIAPVNSILDFLGENLEQYSLGNVSVYWGGRTPEDIYYNYSGHKVINKFIPVLSRGEAGSGYHSGYVQDAIFSEESELNEKFVFACGSMAMIESVSDLFNQNGLPEGNFFSDAFVASSP